MFVICITFLEKMSIQVLCPFLIELSIIFDYIAYESFCNLHINSTQLIRSLPKEIATHYYTVNKTQAMEITSVSVDKYIKCGPYT